MPDEIRPPLNLPHLLDRITTGIEKPISLEAARHLPAFQQDGKPSNASRITRAITEGIKGGIRLEFATIGGRRVTTIEAVDRYLRKLNALPVT